MTNERKCGLIFVDSLDLCYPFNGFAFEDIAPYAIHGVGRIDDHPTIVEALYNLLYQPFCRIIRVYAYKHEIKIRAQKKGKLLISHRYDHLPLLPSGSGGVQQELIV